MVARCPSARALTGHDRETPDADCDHFVVGATLIRPRRIRGRVWKPETQGAQPP